MPSQVSRYVYTAYLIPGPHPLSRMNVYYDRDVVSGLELVALCSECWQMYIDASSGSLSHVKGKLPCLECLGPPAISVKYIYKSSELAHVVFRQSTTWESAARIYVHEPGIVNPDVIGDRLARVSRCSSQCEFNL
jgi:hypothetical protein